MNVKLAVVIGCLIAAAALMFVLAVMGSTPELTVGQILRGEWPPAGVTAEHVARTEISVIGYCLDRDRAVNPTRIVIVDAPPERFGFDQPGLSVDVLPGASMPDEVRPRAWTRVTGTYDPQTNRIAASRVEMKCPSAEEQKLAPTAATTADTTTAN